MYYSSPPSRAVQNISKKYHILAQSREIAQTIKSLASPLLIPYATHREPVGLSDEVPVAICVDVTQDAVPGIW